MSAAANKLGMYFILALAVSVPLSALAMKYGVPTEIQDIVYALILALASVAAVVSLVRLAFVLIPFRDVENRWRTAGYMALIILASVCLAAVSTVVYVMTVVYWS